MESRVVIFLVASLAIIFSYPLFLEKAGIQSPEKVEAPHETPTTKENTTVAPAIIGRTPVENLAVLVSTSTIETVKVIETDLYRAVLSSRGGTLKEWSLKKYSQKDAKGVAQPIQLILASGKIAPLTVTVMGVPDTAPYTFDTSALILNTNKPTGVVVMKTTLSTGASITKEITFHNDQYQADLRVITSAEIQNGYQLALGSNFGITNWEHSMGGSAGAVTMVNGKVVAEHPKNTTITHESGITWFGLQEKYYMSALLPVNKADSMGSVSVQGISEKEVSASISVPPGTRERQFTLYAGPKEYDRLASYNNYLEESIDFGWFIYGSWLPVRLVAKPIFFILRFIHNITQNYGLAIILLTIFIKALFHPITQKSLVSMKQMSSLQPKVEAIKKKWASNKEKMNKEMMALYQEGGVNPLGGCMPMLLQMPVFVALFNVLYVSIDLKGAPFILWITDLSDKDPYYVLPIVMGGTMILQQLTQPSTMDPVQAKMMLFMPVIYTFFFLSFPSGLVLYWLINNVLSIAQQLWINKKVAAAVT